MATKFRSDDTSKWKYAFGSGKDGSTYTVPANAGCSGTSGSTTLTLDTASTFANDVIGCICSAALNRWLVVAVVKGFAV